MFKIIDLRRMITKLVVLYDYQILVLQKYGGISRYYKQLTDSFLHENEIKFLLPVIRSKNYYFEEYCKPNIKQLKKFDILLNCLELYRTYFLHILTHKTVDIIHPTYYYPVYLQLIPSFLKKKSVVIITVYDLICELLYPELEPISKRKDTILKADGIIAISDNTKKDLLKVYPCLDKSKVEVIHLGIDINAYKNYEKIDIPEKYILFVGRRDRYKNGNRYIHAIGEVARKHSDINFVFAGGDAFTEEEKKLLYDEKILNKAFQFNVSDEQLNYLYKNAYCLVFPSLYEGFGIPILEAYACHCPVILSESSCFPEIAADAALYFCGENEQNIADSIICLLNDKGLRNDLIRRGDERVKDFSLEKMVNKTISFYNKMLAGKNIK